MGTRAWAIAAVAGAALPLPVALLPSGVTLELMWVAIIAAAFIATCVGPRLHRPINLGPHRLLTAATGSFVVAAALEVSWWATSPDSLPATVASSLYLVGFVLLAIAVSRFVRTRMPSGDAEGLIDGGLVAVAAAAVLYDVLADPTVVGVYSDAGAAALVLLPVLMAIVLAAVVRLLLAGAHRSVAAWCFFGAAVLSVTGNVRYLTVASHADDVAVRVLFLVGYVLLACGALHRSSAWLGEPARGRPVGLAYGRLTVIGLALAAVPATMLRTRVTGASLVPALAAIVCVALVLWRIARLLRERDRATEALEHRAAREAALSAIGSAAVTATDRDAFARSLAASVDRALDARTALTDPVDLLRHGPAPLSVPLGADLGALEVRFPDGRTADAEDARFARTAADLAAAALRRWDAEDLLRHRSLHDHLTGLPNRALVCERLQLALARTGASGEPLVVLFIDLDGFKAVNDTLGHGAGDAVLGEVAQRLVAQVRPLDLVGRLAGDEFVVVCEGAGTDTAKVLAHRLLGAVSAPFELDLGDATIGASIGVARAEPGDDPESLLHRADEAMYRAKHAGKGRVTLWTGTRPARS